MPQMRRVTTLILGPLVALGQLAGAAGFYWYQIAAIELGTHTPPNTLTPDPAKVDASISWAGVYVMSILAGVLLSVFAAKGYKLVCALVLVILVPALPWLLLLAAGRWFGA